MLPLIALPLKKEIDLEDEETEFGIEDVTTTAMGYNSLGTSDFDELVQKTTKMYPGRVWVCTLRNKTLKRVVPGRDKVTVRSTRYFVEVKVGYNSFHLHWDSGNLNKIAQKAKHSRSLDVNNPSNKFKGLIYDYETILDEISCDWKKNMYKGGYERAQMSNAGLRLLAKQWDNPAIIEGVIERLSFSGTSISEFVKYSSVQKAIGYAIMQGVMRAFSGSLEKYVPSSTLYALMRK